MATGTGATTTSAAGGGPPLTSSNNNVIQEKVQAALRLFAALRESESTFPLDPPPALAARPRSGATNSKGAAEASTGSSRLHQLAAKDADAALSKYEAAQKRSGGRGGGDGSSGGMIYFGTISERDLKAMSSRELIRKLATSEAIIKRLHEKNKVLTRRLETAEAVAKSSGGGAAASSSSSSARVGSSSGSGEEGGSKGAAERKRLQKEVQSLHDVIAGLQSTHEAELMAKDKKIHELQEKHARLSTLLGELEEKLEALKEVEKQQQQEKEKTSPQTNKKKKNASSKDAAKEEETESSSPPQHEEALESLRDEVHRMSIEKEVLATHLSEAERENRHLQDTLRQTQDRLAKVEAALKKAEEGEPDGDRRQQRGHGRQAKHPPPAFLNVPDPSGQVSGFTTPERHHPDADKDTPGSLSHYHRILQDTITALQFRLHQSQAERSRLQMIQLDALLQDAAHRDEPVQKVNEEVKKLFTVMKQIMLSERIEHEAQRQRMNEVLYALEKEVASVGL